MDRLITALSSGNKDTVTIWVTKQKSYATGEASSNLRDNLKDMHTM